MIEKYFVYTDGKTPYHSFIYEEFPKESLENLPHIKELYTGTKNECQLFRENLFLKYNLFKAKEIIKGFLEANNELDMFNAQWKAEQFLKEVINEI